MFLCLMQSPLLSCSFSGDMESSHMYLTSLLSLSLSENTQTGGQMCPCSEVSSAPGRGDRSSGGTVYSIYSWDLTGHPRGQGSLDPNHTALGHVCEHVCVWTCTCIFLRTILSRDLMEWGHTVRSSLFQRPLWVLWLGFRVSVRVRFKLGF